MFTFEFMNSAPYVVFRIVAQFSSTTLELRTLMPTLDL